MPASPIYHKTRKGMAALASPGNGLTLQQRRILILVNGRHNVEELAHLALCDDFESILKTLAHQGFIDDTAPRATTVTAQDYALNR